MTDGPLDPVRLASDAISPTREALADLLAFGTCRLVDALGVGLISPEIGPLLTAAASIVGPAVTVRVTPGDFQLIPWAVDRLAHGDVLIIDGAGHRDRAIWGDFVSTRARQVGCAGVVVDGACRDVAGIRRLGLPVFSRALTARGPTRDGGGAINVPVSCGGVIVAPGDLVVADEDGVVAMVPGQIEGALRLVRAERDNEPYATAAPESPDAAWARYLELQGTPTTDGALTRPGRDQAPRNVP
jgi:RraA family protein